MSRGRRYEGEPKLNIKKVFAVLIAIAAIVMFGVGLKILVTPTSAKDSKTVAIKYYPVYTGEKWGVINSKGNIIVSPTYDDMIVIPDNSKGVFICTYDVDYSKNTYKTKVVNEKNKEVISGYETIEAIENYDKDNTLWYEKDILKVKKDGKYGLIDFKGRQIVSCEYDSITALKGTTNSLLTIKDGQKGIIDNTGAVIIENKYKNIKAISEKYENGYIVQDSSTDKYGVINWNKKVALENKYEEIKEVYGNGNYYIVKQNGKWQIVDKEGTGYLVDKFTDIISINNENAIVKQSEKYGVVSIKDAKKIIDYKYDEIKIGTSENYIVKTNNKYGIIDSEGKTLIEAKYKSIVYRDSINIFEATNENYTSDLIDSDMKVKLTGIVSAIDIDNGYMKIRVGNEYKYYNFKFEEKQSKDIFKNNTIFLSKKDGKYGFVNGDGIVVVDYTYDDASEQNEYGYASVKKDGLWGCINAKGEVVVAPTYKLDNNVVNQFIDKWHLAEDLNLYYFTDK